MNYFGGGGKTGSFDTSRLHDRLRDVTTVNGDFARTMRRWDSPTTLHYLDPPYTSKDTIQYNEAGVTPSAVEKVARRMHGKVIVSYDNSAGVRTAFTPPQNGTGGPFRYGEEWLGARVMPGGRNFS